MSVSEMDQGFENGERSSWGLIPFHSNEENLLKVTLIFDNSSLTKQHCTYFSTINIDICNM